MLVDIKKLKIFLSFSNNPLQTLVYIVLVILSIKLSNLSYPSPSLAFLHANTNSLVMYYKEY